MRGIKYPVIIAIVIRACCIVSRRRLHALVDLQQVRMRFLEVDERGCQPCGVVVKGLTLQEPVAHV